MTAELGQKIKSLRVERGWTQNELAKRTSLDRGYLAYIESGRVGKPSADTFLKLARAFNIRPEELYQAAGYIKDDRRDYQPRQETSEEILERLRLAHPVSIPIYPEYPFHAGEPVEPVDYVYRTRPRGSRTAIEGYIVHGKCLEPIIQGEDVIIVDREAEIDAGNIVACLAQGGLYLGRLRKIADELYLENNEGRIKFAECQVAAPVIEVIRRLK